jgi:hypothetical protein
MSNSQKAFSEPQEKRPLPELLSDTEIKGLQANLKRMLEYLRKRSFRFKRE